MNGQSLTSRASPPPQSVGETSRYTRLLHACRRRSGLRLRAKNPEVARGGHRAVAIPPPGDRNRRARHQGPLQALGPGRRVDHAQPAPEHARHDVGLLDHSEDGHPELSRLLSGRVDVLDVLRPVDGAGRLDDDRRHGDHEARLRSAVRLRHLGRRRRCRQPALQPRAAPPDHPGDRLPLSHLVALPPGGRRHRRPLHHRRRPRRLHDGLALR